MKQRCNLLHKKLNEQGIKLRYIGMRIRMMTHTFGRDPKMYFQEYKIEHRGHTLILEVKITGRPEYFIRTPDEKFFEITFNQRDAITKITSLLDKEV